MALAIYLEGICDIITHSLRILPFWSTAQSLKLGSIYKPVHYRYKTATINLSELNSLDWGKTMHSFDSKKVNSQKL